MERDILMVNPFFIPYLGGTEKVIYEISKRLVNDFDITVLTTRWKGTKKEEYIDGIRVVRAGAIVIKKLPHPLPPPYALAPGKRNYIMKESKTHRITHFHNRFFYNPLDFFLVKKVGKKLALTLHNSRPEGIDPVTDLVGSTYDDTVGKMIFEKCDYITAVSRDTMEKTLDEEFWAKTKVIYNGVDEKKFNPKADGSWVRERLEISDEIVVLTVARLVEQKGIKYLIDAVQKLGDYPLKLVIKGDGPKKNSLIKRAKKLGIEDKVIFFDEKIPEQDLPGLYTAADMFVLPSLYEPFGLVVTEAMASGLPVIASRVGGLKEVVTPETGFLFEPRNPDDLAGKIALLASDKGLRKNMGRAGRKRILDIFTWDKIAKEYKLFYQRALEL